MNNAYLLLIFGIFIFVPYIVIRTWRKKSMTQKILDNTHKPKPSPVPQPVLTPKQQMALCIFNSILADLHAYQDTIVIGDEILTEYSNIRGFSITRSNGVSYVLEVITQYGDYGNTRSLLIQEVQDCLLDYLQRETILSALSRLHDERDKQASVKAALIQLEKDNTALSKIFPQCFVK